MQGCAGLSESRMRSAIRSIEKKDSSNVIQSSSLEVLVATARAIRRGKQEKDQKRRVVALVVDVRASQLGLNQANRALT